MVMTSELAGEWATIMDKKMETTIVYWGYIGDYIGIMEKKMETTGSVPLASKLIPFDMDSARTPPFPSSAGKA